MNTRTPVILLVHVIVCTSSRDSFAWPIDPDPGPPTLTILRDESDVCVLGKCVAAASADKQRGFTGETTFEIVDIARSAMDIGSIGASIKIRKDLQLPPGELFLLTRSRSPATEWAYPLPFSTAAFAYVKEAPPESLQADQRLRYFLRHLEHSDPEIANDAFGEFERARFADLGVLASVLPHDGLRNWLEDSSCEPTRVGLYGIMLGLCGNSEDAEFLRAWIMRSSDEYRIGLDGIFTGYLLLTGEDGLQLLIAPGTSPKDVPASRAYASLQALRFVWTYAPGRLSYRDLMRAMRNWIEQPDVADAAIETLARWEDWSIIDRLMESYDDVQYNNLSIKRAIARYCVRAAGSVVEGPGAADRDHVIKARQFLGQLRGRDPSVVRHAEQFPLRD